MQPRACMQSLELSHRKFVEEGYSGQKMCPEEVVQMSDLGTNINEGLGIQDSLWQSVPLGVSQGSWELSHVWDSVVMCA